MSADLMPNRYVAGQIDVPPQVAQMVARRDGVLGASYRLQYRRPLQFVRGDGMWLFDPDGPAYLDFYNNVPSLGHCNPEVVAAMAAQGSRINANSRHYVARTTIRMFATTALLFSFCSLRFTNRAEMAEPYVIGAQREKRAELSGLVRQMEEQHARHRSNLAHLDPTMRLFGPAIRPGDIRPHRPHHRNAWFRPGECRRLIYDVLCEAPEALATRELAEQIMRGKAMMPDDQRSRDLIQRIVLSSLNRAGTTIQRRQRNGTLCWQLPQAA